MIINLKELFNIVGERKELDCLIGQDELSDVRGCSFCSPVHVKGRIYNKAGVVYLKYSVDFTLNITCDRCLAELERDYHFESEHIVVSSVSSDNDEYIVADGESIDLNEIAVTDLLLQLPTKNLCKEDCKGLCMVCGCDLNESECDCLN
ncbi:MAG: DUF177 domain-containing protein [Ruminococcus sp.]|nr:DUF177 domain-containing protein [Ruminococcus sp.]